MPHNLQFPVQYKFLTQSLDKIGWLRTMEGMLSKEILLLECDDILEPYCKLSQTDWARTLMRKLLEATHSVWIYRNLTMHGKRLGLLATQEIEHSNRKGG
jgi:hypothetical protein